MTQWRWPRPTKRAGYGPRPLTVEELENRNLLSITVGALGDSITAPYQGNSKGAAGDRSWAELLQTLRSPEGLTVANVAVNGATSASLLAQGQHTKVAELVAEGAVQSALLFVGVNDVTVNLGGILAGNPGPFLQTLTADLTTVLGTVSRAGPVDLVVANIPDTGATPFIQGILGSNPAAYERLTGTIALANQRIEAVAAAYRAPVLDLFALSHRTRTPLALGGAEVSRFLAPDGWHPGTVTQGLIANTFLAALNVGYGVDVSGLALSDQEILTAAGVAHPPGTSYLDVSGLVIRNGNPASSTLEETPSQTPAADPGVVPLRWAGFGQALHADKAGLSAATTTASAGGHGLPAWAGRGVAADQAVGSPVPARTPFAAPARPSADVPVPVLDAVFAEADAAFFQGIEAL